MINSFDDENLMTEEEFLAWYETASIEEKEELRQWHNNIHKWTEDAYSKARAIGKHIPSIDDAWDLAEIYDSIVSHNASRNAQKKTHPIRDRARAVAAQEKLSNPYGYVKRTWRLPEFEHIPWDTFKDWFK
jgi:hypothetical protein